MSDRAKQFACGCVGTWSVATKKLRSVTACLLHDITPEQFDLVFCVLNVERTCKGKYVFDSETQNALREEWLRLDTAKDFASAATFLRSLEARLKKNLSEVPVGDWETLFKRVADLIYIHRQDCGYDFNETILAGFFDGQEHDYTCPKCGVTGSYRSASL